MRSLEDDFRVLQSISDPGSLVSEGCGDPSEFAPAARIKVLLEQIHAFDHSMDEARRIKIASIQDALAAGTYHVSATDVAAKFIERIRPGECRVAGALRLR